MSKKITRIVLTGGPAAGKTTLISRILKEFTQEDGWKVVIIPETATELISGFGIGPFPGCMSMLEFQYFVIEDQLHKERLALKAAETVPEEKVLIIYDRAIFDDKAYISDEEFRGVLAHFGKTEEELLAGYDAVLHLVSCAKGAEFAYDYGNAARYETVEQARAIDDRTIRAWSAHPSLHPPRPSLLRATWPRSSLASGPAGARGPLSLLRACAQPSRGPERPSCPAPARCPKPPGATSAVNQELVRPAPPLRPPEAPLAPTPPSKHRTFRREQTSDVQAHGQTHRHSQAPTPRETAGRRKRGSQGHSHSTRGRPGVRRDRDRKR